MGESSIRIKRVYDDPDPSDGYRVLVDRLWPRGVRREDARLDLWLKEVAPSNELRRWFGHDSDRLDGFAARYGEELAGNPAVETLREAIATHDVVTLLYGARDPVLNQARVLRDWLGDHAP